MTSRQINGLVRHFTVRHLNQKPPVVNNKNVTGDKDQLLSAYIRSYISWSFLQSRHYERRN